MKKIIILLSLIIILVIGFNFYNSTVTSDPRYSKIIYLKKTPLKVEVAKDLISLEKGLGGRASMKMNEGMLFIMQIKNSYTPFWMKGMEIPLDIIWIKDNKIVDISENAPIVGDIPDNEIPRYTPKSPYDYVVEVNAGYSKLNNLKINDAVDLKLEDN